VNTLVRSYFVSDLHLKSRDDERTLAFVNWLGELANTSDTKRLFLVGDIFDLWIGDHAFFIDRFQLVVLGIRRLIQNGVEVHFFEGNHDLHLRQFWQEDVGAIVHSDAIYFELDGHMLRVEHGDLMNPHDRGYIFLRWFLRTKLMTYFALNMPSWFINRIGEWASQLSRAYHVHPTPEADSYIRSLVREHAKRAYQIRPFDLIISGHVHVADDFLFTVESANSAAGEARQVRSINLGSWFERPYHSFVLESATLASAALNAQFVDLKI
jgi:UDP-2,3-diacylglucosamine hydrolase